jgi:hypothetical protein
MDLSNMALGLDVFTFRKEASRSGKDTVRRTRGFSLSDIISERFERDPHF